MSRREMRNDGRGTQAKNVTVALVQRNYGLKTSYFVLNSLVSYVILELRDGDSSKNWAVPAARISLFPIIPVTPVLTTFAQFRDDKMSTLSRSGKHMQEFLRHYRAKISFHAQFLLDKVFQRAVLPWSKPIQITCILPGYKNIFTKRVRSLPPLRMW